MSNGVRRGHTLKTVLRQMATKAASGHQKLSLLGEHQYQWLTTPTAQLQTGILPETSCMCLSRQAGHSVPICLGKEMFLIITEPASPGDNEIEHLE